MPRFALLTGMFIWSVVFSQPVAAGEVLWNANAQKNNWWLAEGTTATIEKGHLKLTMKAGVWQGAGLLLWKKIHATDTLRITIRAPSREIVNHLRIRFKCGRDKKSGAMSEIIKMVDFLNEDESSAGLWHFDFPVKTFSQADTTLQMIVVSAVLRKAPEGAIGIVNVVCNP